MDTKTILKEHQKLNTLPFHIEKFCPTEPIRIHYHDCVELIFCTGGYGLTQFENSCLKLKKGDLFVIGGKATHTMSDLKDFSAYRILFDFSMLDNLDEEIKNTVGYTSMFLLNESGDMTYAYKCCICMDGMYFDRLLSLMNELLLEYETQANKHYLRTMFHSICMLIIKCFESRPPKHTKILFDKSIAVLTKSIDENKSMEEIAASLGICERYFRRFFTEKAGVSPAQFVTDMRLRRAKSLLSCSDKSITEIAFSCGFYDSSHLVRVFKKNEGVTPKEYRKRTRL
jgi:AraC-like DNA-binding protein